MKKKIIIGAILIVISAIVAAFFYRERIAIELILKDSFPREPKNQVEVTYNIGWWSHQDHLRVDSFNVEIIDSRLNLFNSNSLIKYEIKGRLVGKNNWEPYIEKVHVSERFIREYDRTLHPYLDSDTSKIPEAIIEFTPIVKVKEKKNYKGEEIPFHITNEMKIQSFHWGNNWLRLSCDSLNTDLILKQRK